NQGIGRTFDAPGMTQGPENASGEGGLSRAQLTGKVDDHAAVEARGEGGAKGEGVGLFGEKSGEGGTRDHRAIMIEATASRQPRYDDTQHTKAASGRVKRKFLLPPFSMPAPSSRVPRPSSLSALAHDIKRWGAELGFQQVGIAGCELGEAETRLLDWLGKGYHGGMGDMERPGTQPSRPADPVPGTLRGIPARMRYPPPAARDSWEVLAEGSRAYVSRYALGRDYHKVMRARMQKLADRVAAEIGEFRHRVFTDTAPVMEVELAKVSGLGWRGKHTLLLNREAGSYFFLGEIYTDLPLPLDEAQGGHCGTCSKCIDICPTQAIVGPYELDARRCISYLTIEHKGAIPEELRPLIGNRVYGCDDCQLVCPWNKFAQGSGEADFAVRNGLDDVSLV